MVVSRKLPELRYNLAGFNIASDIALRGLYPAKVADTAADVTICRAGRGSFSGRGSSSEVATLDHIIPEVGRFAVRDGSQITYETLPDVRSEEVAPYLVGSAFGALCHQRGVLPLHSAAIAVRGGCVAFVGDSGAGKSTMAAALAERGFDVIADDVSFLRIAGGSVLAWPGLSHIRLWEDALGALGLSSRGASREFRGYNKFILPLPARTTPLRLHRIYQLHAAPDDRATITPLKGASAAEVLMQNVYRRELAEQMGLMSEIFSFCVSAATKIAVYRFSRGIGFDILQTGLETLTAHFGRDLDGLDG